MTHVMRSHLPSLITELSYYTVRCLWLNSWSVSPWQEQTSSHHPKNDARHHCATLQQPRSSAPWTTAQWKHQARETIKVETPCHLEEANYLAVDFKEAKSNVNLKNPHLWRHQGNPLWSAQVPRYLPGNGPQICQFHPCQVVGVSKFKKTPHFPFNCILKSCRPTHPILDWVRPQNDWKRPFLPIPGAKTLTTDQSRWTVILYSFRSRDCQPFSLSDIRRKTTCQFKIILHMWQTIPSTCIATIL